MLTALPLVIIIDAFIFLFATLTYFLKFYKEQKLKIILVFLFNFIIPSFSTCVDVFPGTYLCSLTTSRRDFVNFSVTIFTLLFHVMNCFLEFPFLFYLDFSCLVLLLSHTGIIIY